MRFYLNYRRLNLTGRTCALVAGEQDLGPASLVDGPYLLGGACIREAVELNLKRLREVPAPLLC